MPAPRPSPPGRRGRVTRSHSAAATPLSAWAERPGGTQSRDNLAEIRIGASAHLTLTLSAQAERGRWGYVRFAPAMPAAMA
jgi:hypothetical protein